MTLSVISGSNAAWWMWKEKVLHCHVSCCEKEKIPFETKLLRFLWRSNCDFISAGHCVHVRGQLKSKNEKHEMLPTNILEIHEWIVALVLSCESARTTWFLQCSSSVHTPGCPITWHLWNATWSMECSVKCKSWNIIVEVAGVSSQCWFHP